MILDDDFTTYMESNRDDCKGILQISVGFTLAGTGIIKDIPFYVWASVSGIFGICGCWNTVNIQNHLTK